MSSAKTSVPCSAIVTHNASSRCMLGPLIMEQHPQSLQSPWASFPHPAQHSLAVTAQAFSLPVHFELCLLQHCHLPQCQPRPAPSYEATRRSSLIPETKCDKDINCLSYVLHGVKRAGAMEHPSHNDTHAGDWRIRHMV